MLRRQAAFTLVELLVVIGIISLLISILLPALNKARESANDLKCKSNMRTIGQAFVMYTNLSKGRLPATRMCGQSYTAGDVTVTNKVIFWYERLMGDRLLPMPSAGGASDSVLVCPSQTEAPVVSAWGGIPSQRPAADDARLNRFRLSYGINNWLSIDDFQGAAPTFDKPDLIDDSIGQGWKLSIHGQPEYPKSWGIKGSSEKVLLADNKQGFQLYHWLPNSGRNLPANISDEIDWKRHGGKAKLGRANFLFADGHVASMTQGVDATGKFNELCGMDSSVGDDVKKKGARQWWAVSR